MASGTLLLASLLLTAGQAPGQAPADVAYYNTRSLTIPIDIHPEKRAEISQLLLFVSSDHGKTWPQEAVVPPDNSAFMFHAPADGEYWLRVAAINKQGKQEPDNISNQPAEATRKVLIDTLKPTVKIVSARRVGEEVLVRWEIQEQYPDRASLKVEYRAADAASGPWTAVASGRQLIDEGRLRPGTAGPVLVRVQIKDLAGNVSYAQAEVPGTGGITAASFKSNGADAPLSTAVPPVAPPPAPVEDMSPDVKPTPRPDVKTEGSAPVDPAPSSVSTSPPAGYAPPPPQVPSPAAPATSPAPTVATVPPAVTPMPSPPLDAEPKVVARSDAPATPTPPPAAPAPPAHPGLPMISRLVNNPHDVVLKYKLDKVGPSGIGSVELYLTDNDGRTWQPFAEDPEASKLTGNGTVERRVDLPGEGVYGFRLVVKSKAGRGRPAPLAGDAPEIRIEVDTTKPEAVLLEPRPDPKRRDALILQWRVKDRNLDDRPITLEYADQPDGKWETIVANYRDTPDGFSWQVPPGKVNVYLRLRVRDKAGNEAIAITSEPQLVDMSEPEGQLIDVSLSPH